MFRDRSRAVRCNGRLQENVVVAGAECPLRFALRAPFLDTVIDQHGCNHQGANRKQPEL
jgi:hypothetical protein